MSQKTPIVVMADDDADDCMLAKEAFEEVASKAMVLCVEDGIKLMDLLLNGSRLPSLILMDLNMPGKDGRQALKEIRSIQSLQHIPIIIFTTSHEEKDIVFSQEMGADLFFTKPAHFSEWVNIVKMLIQNYVPCNGESRNDPVKI